MNLTHPKKIDVALEDIKDDYFWLEPFLTKTLEMLERNPGIKLETTPYFKISELRLTLSGWWYGCKTTEDIKRRIRKLSNLKESLKKGYQRDKSLIIGINGMGEIVLRDGFHRLIILKYLNYKGKIPAEVRKRDDNWIMLKELRFRLNSGMNLYQTPIHPDFQDWNVWRKDTPERYKAIRNEMKGPSRSILDIGAEGGHFTFKLTKEGYRVIAVESDIRRAYILSCLSRALGISIRLENQRWETLSERKVDYIINLSTFHHSLLADESEALKALFTLSKNAPIMFFSMADGKNSKMKDYPLSLDKESIPKLVLDNTNYTEQKIIYDDGVRPIYKFNRRGEP